MSQEHPNNPNPTGPTQQEDDALAGDLVLGILSDAEREAAERREAAEPAFARLVSAWRQRLALLPDPIEPVTPPKGVWDRIAALIGRK
jgi:anti-sigma-K factor RskA